MTRKPVHPIIQALRAARLKSGLGQAAVARRIGTSQNAVWGWETGRYTPPVDAVAAYAQALGLELTLTPKGDTAPCPPGSTSSPAHAGANAPAPTKPEASSPAATPARSAPDASTTTRRTP